MRELSDDEALRFGRTVLLPEIGLIGQEMLRGSTVRVTPLGAVGSAASLYLAAAGIGGLSLDDPAPVEPADLAGTLYRACDVGTPRGAAARRALAALDPGLDAAATPVGVAVLVEARDHVGDRCRLAVDVSRRVVAVQGGPGPGALLAGAAAAAETVKLLLRLGAPLRVEDLP